MGCCISDTESLRLMLFLPIGVGSIGVGSISDIRNPTDTMGLDRFAVVWNADPNYRVYLASSNSRMANFPKMWSRNIYILGSCLSNGNIETRFWWPGVLSDINQLGLGKRRWNNLFSGNWSLPLYPIRS